MARHFANEMAVVTPEGDLLSHSPEEGLRKWRELPPARRKSLGDLGAYDAALDPAPPAGGLILKVYARGLARGEGGRLAPYKTEVARSWEPGRDHLWLTEAERRALVPEPPVAGVAAEVDPRIVERLCRQALIDLVRVGGNGGPRRPDDVLERSLRVIVEEASPEAVRLRLGGSARLATRHAGFGAKQGDPKVDEFRLEGRAVYDRRKGAFRSFDLLAFSETGHFDEIHGRVLPLGVALELTAGEAPADRIPPSGYGASD